MIDRTVFRKTSVWKKKIGNTSWLYDQELLICTLICKNKYNKGCYCCCSGKQPALFLQTLPTKKTGLERSEEIKPKTLHTQRALQLLAATAINFHKCKIRLPLIIYFFRFSSSNVTRPHSWPMLSTKQYHNYIFFSVKSS